MSEDGAALLHSLSGEVFYVSRDMDEYLSVSQWSAIQVTTRVVEWSMLSDNGLVIVTAGFVNATKSQTVIQLFTLQDKTWARLGEDLLVNQDLYSNNLAAVSTYGHTAAFGFCQSNDEDNCALKVFRFDNMLGWYQLGNEVAVASSPSISLSYVASVLAIADSSGY